MSISAAFCDTYENPCAQTFSICELCLGIFIVIILQCLTMFKDEDFTVINQMIPQNKGFAVLS